MDAGIFARQLTEALDDLTDGIPIETGRHRRAHRRPRAVLRRHILTSDAGFEITAADESRIQVTFIQSARPRT